MEIIYFLLPVVTIVSAIWYFIREMNAASYLRRPATAPVFAANAAASAPDLTPSLEQRYVDWFTSDKASRTREKPGSSNDEDFLADGVIHLDLRREGKSVNLYLAVNKMRKSNHHRGYSPLIFEGGGFEIVTE